MDRDYCGSKDEDEVFLATFDNRKEEHRLVNELLTQLVINPETLLTLKNLFSSTIIALRKVYVDKKQCISAQAYDLLVDNALTKFCCYCKSQPPEVLIGRSLSNMVIFFLRDTVQKSLNSDFYSNLFDKDGLMIPFKPVIEKFFDQLSSSNLLPHLDGKASLQQELGLFLRTDFFLTAFARNVEKVFGPQSVFSKNEIDLSIFHEFNEQPAISVELNFLQGGQYLEQMYQVCQSIKFAEELKAAGFAQSYVLVVVDDLNFCQGENIEGLYGCFRGEKILTGKLIDSTDNGELCVEIKGSYRIEWNDVFDALYKYVLIEV